jgi:hypothetical protein
VVFRWDLDKTYLRSEFDSLRELVKIPFERPEDKVTVPGVIPLIRRLKTVAAAAGRDARVYFISASPPQIAKAIRDKLALDEVDYDGITFKNQLQHIVRGRFRNLREQVGYKLTELLRARPGFAANACEVLFGDDWESDPLIYSLYADVLAGRVEADELRSILHTLGVDPRLIAESAELAHAVARIDAVQRIYINLERRTPPGTFRLFGPRLVPTFNYFQTACCLFQESYLDLPAVAEVASDLIEQSSYTPVRLANSLADLQRRGHVSEATVTALREGLRPRQLLPAERVRPPGPIGWWQRLRRWYHRRFDHNPPLVEAPPLVINYQRLLAEWRQGR